MTQFNPKMENTLIVLLLLCTLSSAEREPPQTNPHPDLPDLYTQLGDVRVQLAEDRLMIKELQKDKEELEAKLKELEERESQLEPIKEKLEEQAAKVEELEKQSDKVATIIDEPEVRQVAFFATFLESGSVFFGKYAAQTLMIFKHVVLNIGSAYSPTTGFFTAPVKGVYHFDFYIFGYTDNTHHSIGAVLVKDGENVAIAYDYHTGIHRGGSASNGATLALEAGNIVSVHLWPNARIYDNNNHHCTFSGHLLFTT